MIFFSYLFAIMAPAWWGGHGPGLLAVALSHFVAPYFLLSNFNPANIEASRVALTTLVSLLISGVAASRRRAETMLRDVNAQLEQRVRERTYEVLEANSRLEALTAELQRKNDELRRSNADLERFAYIASHDLQEPLRMVSTYAELLARRYAGRLDDKADEMVRHLVNGAHRMRDLVGAVLEFSRVAPKPAGALADANQAVIVAQTTLEHLFRENGAILRFTGLPIVAADPAQLTRVFQNLLSNALKYRSESLPVISISAEPKGEYWIFAVRDNGIGIAPEYAQMIFHLFKRLHAWTTLPGTGIGLAICKRIVEQHGGNIWVESVPGAGATFFFTVPRACTRLEEEFTPERSEARLADIGIG
jgi:light-regulated signal transduction histidine kinase (bacteriophytochrome)